MKIFDLHSHPSYKTIFSNIYNPWQNIPAHDVMIGKIIRSQGNLSQISTNSYCNLLCISLYAPETAFVDQGLVKIAGPKITDGLDIEILRKMIKKTFCYHHEIEKEIVCLVNNAQNKSLKSLKILSSFSEYEPEDFSTLYIFFSVEGGHAFYGKLNDDKDINQIIKDFSKFARNHFVFYITPCHLTPNIFLTHAYGNKLLGKGEFIPKNKGITPHGIQFLNNAAEKNMLLDVKHMSLISRQQFYQNQTWNNKPLLCSHAGVTGISWDHKLDRNICMSSIKKGPGFYKINYWKPEGIVKDTLFNPCSINLYDEDIVQIMRSGGLIGISMDMRIIGSGRNFLNQLKLTEKEFVSEEEFLEWEYQNRNVNPLVQGDFEKSYDPQYKWIGNQLNSLIWDEEDITDEFEEFNIVAEGDVQYLYPYFYNKEVVHEEHLRYFVNQLFHIIIIVEKSGLAVNPWEHICIGSDFDGFIRTIDCCSDASMLNAFAERLVEQLETLTDDANISLRGQTPQNIVENIFFNNCYKLLKSLYP